ncbi:expressed unknown protein [Seminavis robusta]|uniref:Uncharacterized protein n=1 Tax=Seminavis robusta TaxID=568900 RepID=A0A9N8H8G9_9STRA|nr:expressed unknown protein [Seminavis robusta]|eukprot:Sro216_g089570.1 n/a (465) ;mRNA; r:87380-88774
MTQTPFLHAQDMIGIWRVCKKVHQPFPNPSEMYKETIGSMMAITTKSPREEIALRLNEDGTFDPYTPPLPDDDEDNDQRDLHHLLGRGGCWTYEDQTLLLAADRPPNADPRMVQDTLFRGRLVPQVSECLHDSNSGETADPEIDVHLAIPQGQISTGKFLYPKQHKFFFEEPILFKPINLGFFFMNQLLGKRNAQQTKPEFNEEDNKPPPLFYPEEFYNRTFYLATAPHPVDEAYAAADPHYDEDAVMWDLRVLQVSFYPNNTFAAFGAEKILRGRFGLMGEYQDHLWLQVNLYGAGRDVSGSVFSEGRLLTQEDRRGYVGPIVSYPNQRNQTTYYVYGEYYSGVDAKRAYSPDSLGTFTLQEIDTEAEEEEANYYPAKEPQANDNGYDSFDDLAMAGFNFTGALAYDGSVSDSGSYGDRDEYEEEEDDDYCDDEYYGDQYHDDGYYDTATDDWGGSGPDLPFQ